jgi:uncharacterized protein YegP (UPF0339 family)
MKGPRFVIYPARDGWRWFLQAANGSTLADSGEAYSTKAHAERAVETVRATARKADVQHASRARG